MPRDHMTGGVRGDPDRLEAFTTGTTRTLPPLGVAIDDYAEAIRALNHSSTDLPVSIPDDSDHLHATLGRLRRVDAAPGAFAWALRRIDRDNPDPGRVGDGIVEFDDIELFHRLVDLRVADPLADDDVIWAEARRGTTAELDDVDGSGPVVKGDTDEMRRLDAAAASTIAASTSLLALVPGLVSRLTERVIDVVDNVSRSLATLVDDRPGLVKVFAGTGSPSVPVAAPTTPVPPAPPPMKDDDDGKGLFGRVFDAGKKLVGDTVDAGRDLVKNTVDAGQKFFGDALGPALGKGLGLDLGGWQFGPVIEEVNRFVRSVNDKAQRAVAIFPGLGEWLTDAWDGLKSVWNGVTDFAGGLWDATLGGLIESIKALIDDPGQWISDVWENIRDLVGLNGAEAAGEAWLSIVKDFVAWDVWAEDPWRALGILVGNILLTLGTLGIGLVVKIILRLIKKRRGKPSPAGDLDADTLRKLSEDLTPDEIKDLSDRLGPETLKKLADEGMSGAAIRQAADDLDPSGKVKVPAKGLPEWLQKVRAGSKFDKERKHIYQYNQLYLRAEDGRRYIVDSYDPRRVPPEIVSRKLTQLWDVDGATAKAYLAEFDKKYAPGTKIDDVKSTPAELKGQRLQGKKILEIPVQTKAVPPAVIEAARARNITIRDVNGKKYT